MFATTAVDVNDVGSPAITTFLIYVSRTPSMNWMSKYVHVFEENTGLASDLNANK